MVYSARVARDRDTVITTALVLLVLATTTKNEILAAWGRQCATPPSLRHGSSFRQHNAHVYHPMTDGAAGITHAPQRSESSGARKNQPRQNSDARLATLHGASP
jgi:hypothetical protein